jgi:hypothetical protein
LTGSVQDMPVATLPELLLYNLSPGPEQGLQHLCCPRPLLPSLRTR